MLSLFVFKIPPYISIDQSNGKFSGFLVDLIDKVGEKAGFGHDPRHPVQADLLAFVGQVFVHARRAEDAPAVLVDFLHALEQPRIGLRPRTRLAAGPGVKAAGRDLQAAAHHPNRIFAAATLDHRVPLGDCFAKNVAASLKKSGSLAIRVELT